MVPAGNKAKRLSSVKHNTKTIHHHHDDASINQLAKLKQFTYTLGLRLQAIHSKWLQKTDCIQ